MNKKLLSTISFLLGGAILLQASDVTIRAVRRPASEVFEEIVRQSGKNFVYSSKLLDKMVVTVNISKQPLEDALESIFGGTEIGYKVKGGNVILFKKEKKENKREAAPVRTVSGFVREAGSGEPLVGAVVRGSGKSVCVTNVQGFYSLTLPEGKNYLQVSYPGFAAVATERFDLRANRTMDVSLEPDGELLDELEVYGDKNNSIAMESASIGALNIGRGVIASTPVIFGESDVIKTLQLEPGVSAGVEGMAGMYVHGGNADENLYMLDNVPLYQVNHFAGLFSAFNTEAIRNVDFYKSSFPARYDGRLSSYMDVHTKDGSLDSHHGSVKLGLTSGAFNIDGPIVKGRTSYSFAIRRSWYDILTIPALAVYNSLSKNEKVELGFAFTDINAKVTHRFNQRSSVYAMFYYGEDYLRVKQSYDKDIDNGSYDILKNNLKWGNIVASAGWNYVVSPHLFGEFTAAFTRYRSSMTHNEEDGDRENGETVSFTMSEIESKNHINDWILRGDFEWHPAQGHTVNFGASYVRHNFLPFRDKRTMGSEDYWTVSTDKIRNYGADEFNVYGSADWTPQEWLRINYGLHFSIFNIEGHTHSGLSPRVSARWTPARHWSVKGGYSHTVQYVRQLIQSSLSLPTDQWVPIIGGQKPQTADKIAVGLYYSPRTSLTFSVEGYWKWMDNLLEYADEYYLLPPDMSWNEKMCSGKGTSKGIDFKVSKEFGNISGHISYSLLWADRQYPDKNNGKKFPARFDNRHKINILANWKINSKWEMNVSWTGMSGNRITLPTQCWSDPGLAPWHYDMTLWTDVNNYRLPFYHRMDLGFTRHTKHGFWNFSLYNAYCNLNTIGVMKDYAESTEYNDMPPAFKQIRLLPVIPSVSYTWIF